MKKFALLLMTLMFTIFSFASPKMIEEQTYDNDVGIENVQIISVDVATVATEVYKIVKYESTMLKVKDSIASNYHKHYMNKYNPYKYMSIADSKDTINTLRQRQDKILYITSLTKIRNLQIPFEQIMI